MVSFAVVSILQLLKTVGKKKKRRNHPQQSTRIIFEYFRSWQTLVILAKWPYCDHPTTILSCRITLVVSFASISIPIVSKLVGNKKKRRNHPQHWVTVIFEYFRIWQTEAVLPKRPYCDHPTTIPSDRIVLLVSFAVKSIPILSKSVEKRISSRNHRQHQTRLIFDFSEFDRH